MKRPSRRERKGWIRGKVEVIYDQLVKDGYSEVEIDSLIINSVFDVLHRRSGEVS